MILSRTVRFDLSEDITKESKCFHWKFKDQIVDGISTVLPTLTTESLYKVEDAVGDIITKYVKEPHNDSAINLENLVITTIQADYLKSTIDQYKATIDLTISLKKLVKDNAPSVLLTIYNV